MLYGNLKVKDVMHVNSLTEEQVLDLTVGALNTMARSTATALEPPKPIVELERYKKFFRAYDTFVKYFGASFTDKYLVTVPFSELYTVQEFQREPTYYTAREFVAQGTYTFKEHRGTWEREVQKPGEQWRIPSNYQGLRHAGIIRQIVAERWPWMADFKYNCYELNTSPTACNEFYLETEFAAPTILAGHLYVPWEAFINNDIEAIKTRNRDYFHWYTHSDEVYKKLMTSTVVAEFFKKLEEQK
jgi:hypothetical protein